MPQPKKNSTTPSHLSAPSGGAGDTARLAAAGAGGGPPEGRAGFVVLGAGGQLGTALVSQLAAQGAPVVALGRAELDLSAEDDVLEATLARAIAQAGGAGSVVLNAAAWTAVDAAEAPENAAEVERVNATAPGVLAGAAARSGAAFIHVSTDYVFGGVASEQEEGGAASGNGGGPAADSSGAAPVAKEPVSKEPVAKEPGDATAPVNEYGRTKLAGEQAVVGAGGYVVRTAWVFSGPAGPGRDFVDTMAGLADRGVDPKVVADQWGRPTFTGHLATGLIELAGRLRGNPNPGGLPHLLHATGGGEPTTWAEFAAAIFEATGHDPARVSRIPTSEYPTPAARPIGVCLGTDSWRKAGLRPLPAWQEGLRAALG